MRPLADYEAQVLLKILASTKGGEQLADQVDSAQVSDESTPTFLRLIIEDRPVAAGFSDGPLPGRFPVDHSGELVGELIVWVKGGRLSALEYAWVSDTAPSRMPDPDEVEVN